MPRNCGMVNDEIIIGSSSDRELRLRDLYLFQDGLIEFQDDLWPLRHDF